MLTILLVLVPIKSLVRSFVNMKQNITKAILEKTTLFMMVFIFVVFGFGVVGVQGQVESYDFYEEQKKLKPENFELSTISKKNDFAITEMPEMEFKFSRNGSFLKEIAWFVKDFFVDEYENMNVIGEVVDYKGMVVKDVKLKVERKRDGKFKINIDKIPRKISIGKYSFRIKINDEILTNGENLNYGQDFSWGVLAFNVNKSVYLLNEEAFLQMAVLDDAGDTLCDAEVELLIVTPDDEEIKFSTDDKTISKNPECDGNNVILKPDYYSYFRVREVGSYKVVMTAKTENGTRVLEDKFEVKENLPLQIERIAPTRIYPYADYEIKLKMKASQDYKGSFQEKVPLDFVIKSSSVKNGEEEIKNLSLRVEENSNEKILIWDNVDIKKGEEFEFSYRVDFPNISPEFYLLGSTEFASASSPAILESRQWQIASDAVGAGVAWMAATSTSNGADMNLTVAYALKWGAQDYDTTKYSYSNLNPTRLVVKEGGDFLLAITIPMNRIDAVNNRTRIEADIRVNGTKRSVGVSRPSYIRNSSGHTESSNNMSVMIEDLNVNDYIEIFVHGITSNRSSVYITDQASLYVEHIPSTEVVFVGTATQTTNGTDLSDAIPYELEWTEGRNDTGITHSDVTASEDIILDAIGDYLVFVNVPVYTTVARANLKGTILLDGAAVSGGSFLQGYVRNLDSDSYASIHWSGVVRTTAINQVLSISTEEDSAAATVTVNGENATVYVQKLPSSDIFYSRGTNLEASQTNWNQTTAYGILWENDDIIDTNTFTHSTTLNQHQITVGKAGDYFVAYNDAMDSGAGRPNNRIEMRVNGTAVTGSQTLTHYMRLSTQDSSASLTFLLTDLAVNDIISVTTVREADSDTVDDMDDSVLFIRYIDDKIPPVATINSLAQKTDGTGAIDISIEAVDGNNDDVRAKIEYVDGVGCDFASPNTVTIDSTDINVSADFGDPDVDNANEYKVGTTSAMILTNSGSNTVLFDWLSKNEIDDTASTYCVQVTLQDETGKNQTTGATSTIFIDNLDPIVTNVTLPDEFYSVGDTLTATVTVQTDSASFTNTLSTINGATTTNLIKINDTTYTLDYTVVNGDSDRATGTIPYSIKLADQYGNKNTAYTGSFSTGAIDANAPNIISVTVFNDMFGIGDILTATITVSSDIEVFSLETSTINGVTATGLNKINNTTYTLNYTIVEGDSDRATGTIPYSISLSDEAGNVSSASVGTLASGSVDANRPVIQAVYISNGNYKIGDSIKIVIDTTESGLHESVITVNNKNITGFNDIGDTTYEVYYTVQEGDTDRTANTIPLSVVMRDDYYNTNSPYTSPANNTATVDANKPKILYIYLPNQSYKIGDILTATATVLADDDSYTLGTTTINSVAAGNLVRISSTTYTFDYTVGNGNADRAAGTIPISLMLKDSFGQYNDPASTTVQTNTASIDANKPSVASISFVPSSGVLKVGDTATATVSAVGAETGLSAGSTMNINAVNVISSFFELGGGDYRLVYTVSEGDTDHPDNDDLPVNLRFFDPAGNESDAYLLADSANRPGVDGNSPVISDVYFSPSSGVLKVGDIATATLVSDGTNYTAGIMTINGVDVSSTLTASGTTDYTVTYTVGEGETDIQDSANLPLSFTLIDPNSNSSLAYVVEDVAGRPGIDANTPVITNVYFNITSGLLKIGDIATATIQSDGTAYTAGTITINGVDVSSSLTASGTNEYTVAYTVVEGNTDISDSSDLPISIVLIDLAGNESLEYSTADAGNRPGIDANRPTISSVSFLPTSGILNIASSATSTISAGGSETGLLIQTATINSVDVSASFNEIGGGDYELVYTVVEGHTDIADIADLPVYYIIRDVAGNLSDSFNTADASSRPGVDGHKPVINNVYFNITSGVLKIGDMATATIQSDGLLYTAGTISINGVDVSGTLVASGTNEYTVTYTVVEGNTDILDVNDLPISVSLIDVNGNVSDAYVTADAGNRPGIDANRPNISVVTFNPSSGLLSIDDIATATLTTIEAGCSVVSATINAKDLSGTLIDNGDSTYAVVYEVQSGDTDVPDSNDLPVSFQLQDSAGNVGTVFNTADIGGRPGVDANLPTAPGSLTFDSNTSNSVTLNFGTAGSDASFSEYKIYYKKGTSGVTEADSVWDSSDDANLGAEDFNSAVSTTITGLATSTSYVFNIYIYDTSGNRTSAFEVTFKTNSYPQNPGVMEQYKSDGVTVISNNGWVDDSSLVFRATSTDIDSEDSVTLYYEFASTSESLRTASTVPASTCSDGTAYNSCTSKIWSKSAATPSWYDTSWSNRKKITVQASQILSNETDFVVLATTTDSDLVGKIRNDGYDILFTSSDGQTKLEYEREFLATSTGQLVAWIKTDISSTINTVLYMYYGNSNATTDNATTTGVWDSDYRGVWHMGDDPSGLVYDSTFLGNDMTADASMNSGNLVQGAVGQALSFDGSAEELVNSSPSGYTAPSDYTMSGWFYYATDPSGYDNFYSHTTGSGNYDPQWTMNGTAVTVYDGSGISFGNYSGGAGSWHKIDFIRTGDASNNVVAYIDGQQFGTAQSHTADILVPTTLYIGASSLNGELWTGNLDEIRYSEIARSVDFIKTEYNNQIDSSAFLSFNAEEEIYTTISIPSFPEYAPGYKWQVMACDNEGACSPWKIFNAVTPNFKIDLAIPTQPGKLTFNSKTSTSVKFNFGATTTEANFDYYKIFYKIGSTTNVTESDLEFGTSSDANLGDILFNGEASTTIFQLTASTTYSFSIWAYDIAGNKASSSVTVVTTNSGGNPPSGIFNSAAQKDDGSGRVDISIEVDDPDNDDILFARVDYELGASCTFSPGSDPTLDENLTNVSADNEPKPTITNINPYQIGTSSAWILTSPGSNTINFDWLSQTDESLADGIYCLQLTVNDGSQDQLVSATTTLMVDNTKPSSPGVMSTSSVLTSSVVLNFGSDSSDTNFKEYKIFYKLGDSGVSENDNVHDQNDDINLGAVDFNSFTTTTISGLQSGVTYVFNIYAYDDYGNVSSSTEITATTNYTPDAPVNLHQTLNDNSIINNGILIQESSVKLSATTTDINVNETINFYFEIIPNTGTFTSSLIEPVSSCADGTAYSSCGNNIWTISTSTGSVPPNWYNQNWIYRKKLSIQSSQVTANETDFPVLIEVTDTDLAGKIRSDGFDLVFTNSNGVTELDYEREYLDSLTGKLTAWVKTSISSTTDTDIYMYYGNGNEGSDHATTTALWDSNYKGVWHLAEDPTGTVYDSTVNANNMTSAGSMTSNNLVDGQMGEGIQFDGTNDSLDNTSPSGYGTPGDFSVSAWFFYTSNPSGYDNFYSHTDVGNYDPQWSFNNTTLVIYDEGAINGSTAPSTNSWHRMDIVRSGTTVSFYIDGVFDATGSRSYTDVIGVPSAIFIGNSSSAGGESFNGVLDELRYSEIVRSADTIKTEFNNQNNPSTFVVFSSEEPFKYTHKEEVSVTLIPDSNDGYKWQVMACDDDSACSSWSAFNVSIPNFKVDATAPTAPGNLSALSQTGDSITIKFGSSTEEENFTEYKIFYKEGSSGVTESDVLYGSSTDADLGFIDYNSTTNTVINGLNSGTEYVFNIWAYDAFGRKASATVELVTSTNFTPTSTIVSAVERTDGSGVVDLSIIADDGNDDDLSAKLEFATGTTCVFTNSGDPTLDETDVNATSTQGDAKIENDNVYQIGNASGWIETSGGVNTTHLDWLTSSDLPIADGSYCLQLTANDSVDDQEVLSTTTLEIDNTLPTVPGDLSLSSETGSSITLNFGTETIERNFSFYKIFYVEGASTVDEDDTEHIDVNLNNRLFNGESSTTVSGLLTNTQYSFRIYAYDTFGNKSNSGQVTFTTNAPPTGVFNSAALKTDASGVVDISIEVYDVNGDPSVAKIEYVQGATCDFSGLIEDPTLDETDSNITADHEDPDILNAQVFQIGATTDIVTASGSNTVNFDWDTLTDLPTGNDVYCLRLTVNDGDNDQDELATTTVIIDNVVPVAPGNLTVESVTGLDATLAYGVSGTDTNFKEYKIFYKKNISGVTESDLEWNKNNDSSLSVETLVASTTITSLDQNSLYYFNIWIYDDYGHSAVASGEVSTTTLIIPSATWRENEDTVDPSVSNYLGETENFRLRISVANTGDWNALDYKYQLEYGIKGEGCSSVSTWVSVPAVVNGEHFEMVSSDYFTNYASTTQKLTSEGSFTPGYILEDSATSTGVQDLLAGEFTEIEYAIEATASSIPGETYCFRVTDEGRVIDDYNIYPELTVAPPPLGSFVSAGQRTDGSGVVDIKFDVSDGNGNPSKASLIYATGTVCDFSSFDKPLIDTNPANVSATYGIVDIDNLNLYQIGTTSNMIETSFGTNTLEVDWDVNTQFEQIDETFCMQLTANDGFSDQIVSATTTVTIDHFDPTTPGNLVEVDSSSNSVTVGITATSSDTNFLEYRIYYKEGASGVTESDTLWGTSSDAKLSDANLNGATTTTITGLEVNKQYVFRIWAYDEFGNKSASVGELSVIIKYLSRSENWRFYYDHTNETPTSTIAEENTAPNTITDGSTIKLRLALREIENITGENIKIRLQYSTFSDFSSNVNFVGEIGSTSATWTYGDGIDDDDDAITQFLLSGMTAGATHNESGISTSSYDHLGGTAAEWEFTIHNNGAPIATTYYFRAYDNLNGSAILTNVSESYPSLVTQAQELSASIAGVGLGQVVEGVTTNIVTTAESIDFGTLVSGDEKIGVHRFTVNTNAGYGYQLFVSQRQSLLSNNGASIVPVTSTNGTPASWPLSPSPSAFGYHTSDDTLSGSSPSRFAPDNSYAQLETNIKEVGYSPIPVTGDVVDVIYRIETDESQSAGDYETEIVYILIPIFY